MVCTFGATLERERSAEFPLDRLQRAHIGTAASSEIKGEG
jgi:hypothetical protein